ncbi:MAG: hypothetical protein QM692_12765 [Thermomicrobiales bacterium]
MDDQHFDTLTRVVGNVDSRRRLLRQAAGLAVLGGLLTLLDPDETGARGRRKRRVKRHKHGKGRRRENRRGTRRKAPANCAAEPAAQTCAGRCGQVQNTCGQLVECGNACSGTAPFCVETVCAPCSASNPCQDGCCQPDGACGATCRVFTSSAVLTTTWGGLAEGDAICQGLAGSAGLPGQYFAWLSDATDSPSTRFPLAGNAAVGPYVLVGTPVAVVATDWTDLTTCDGAGNCLQHTLARTETGDPWTGPMVWTGTGTAGDSASADYICQGWTTTSGLGAGGTATATNWQWTNVGIGIICAAEGSLYCFQQG